jgi:hypothetical protein
MKLLKVCALALFAALVCLPFTNAGSVAGQAAAEAPTSIDLTTNGFVDQATMDSDRAEFEPKQPAMGSARSTTPTHAPPATQIP